MSRFKPIFALASLVILIGAPAYSSPDQSYLPSPFGTCSFTFPSDLFDGGFEEDGYTEMECRDACYSYFWEIMSDIIDARGNGIDIDEGGYLIDEGCQWDGQDLSYLNSNS